jgi:hypothetical protein
MEDYVKILDKEFSSKGYKMPTMKVGSCLFSFIALCDK